MPSFSKAVAHSYRLRQPLDRAMKTKRAAYTADMAADPVPGSPARLGGARSAISVPMLKDDDLVGTITIYRQEVRPFTDKQIELVQNFAAQAVIAIENTRLLSELRQRTGDLRIAGAADGDCRVLRVISSSPGELEPVFQAMLENATRICEANFGTLFLREGEHFAWRACITRRPTYIWRSTGGTVLLQPLGSCGLFSSLGTKRVHIVDLSKASSSRPQPKAVNSVEARRRSHSARRADAQGRRADRRHHHLSPGGAAVHRQANRAGAELRRPGRHRHREHAAAQRIAAIAGAADGDGGGAAGHQHIAGRS